MSSAALPPPPSGAVYVETCRPGIAGRVAAALFFGWNLLTALWLALLLVATIAGLGRLPGVVTLAFTACVWVGGALPLAVLRHVTRGRRMITVKAR